MSAPAYEAPLKGQSVAVSGATGLIGKALTERLTRLGARPVRITRQPPANPETELQWDPARGIVEPARWATLAAVVHLAGESIASGRWTTARKAAIRDSRVIGTRTLAESLARMERRPATLVCASAIGFYGDRGDDVLDESSPPGSGFLPDVCREWEAATQPARDAGIRVVNVRTGVVLSREGGALAKMLLPFKLCVGGVIGSGRQYWSWVALDDVVGGILHALTQPALDGPLNAVSPHPVTNAVFTQELGAVLNRPTIFPLPAFAARIVLGEMADGLLLASARVLPKRLEETGYQFRYTTLRPCLEAELKRPAR